MKILWITSFVLPQAAEYVGVNKIHFGGWVSQMINQLKLDNNVTLGIAMKSSVKTLKKVEENNVSFYFFPEDPSNKNDITKTDCCQILSDFSPDLLHAEGTEFPYTRTFLLNWEGVNIVSLQGILNGYKNYEYGGLSPSRLIFEMKDLKDMIYGILMILNKHFVFKKRLPCELETLALANNFTGRTTWDRANSYFYNRKATYYYCPRILRPSFYKVKQQKSNILKHSVFIGNSAQARKGAHFVVEAIALLKDEYPNIKLHVAGQEYQNSIKDLRTFFGYRAYLKRKICRLKLEKHIEFLGVLNEANMAKNLSKMNVYVMSSVIENSPNTLGEAMIMGVPCVTSFNGGVADMANNEEEALHYRDNDPRMLAYQIKRIFDNQNLADKLSENAIRKASLTHDPDKNLEYLVNSYKNILS
jgi:glycosyltransferase involved in cell wall biosynthesis